MAHSVELLLDETSDQQIRRQWQLLHDAGLPSQTTVRSATKRPHVTLLAAHRIDPAVDNALAGVAVRLPFGVTIGAPIVFGTGTTRSLARLVVPSSELLSVHAQVIRLGTDHAFGPDDRPGLFAHCSPGKWTPHVTLARRIPVDRIGAALEIVGDPSTAPASSIDARVVGLRRWDSDAKTDNIIAGRAC